MDNIALGFLIGIVIAAVVFAMRERYYESLRQTLVSCQEEIAELQEQLGDYRKQLDEQEEQLTLATRVFRGECELLIAASGARSATLFALDVPTGHPRRGVVSTTALAVVENAPLVLSHWRDQCDNALGALGVVTPKTRKPAARTAQQGLTQPAQQTAAQTPAPQNQNGARVEVLKSGQTKVVLPDGRIVLVEAGSLAAKVFAAKK